jgi:hypothetical protein
VPSPDAFFNNLLDSSLGTSTISTQLPAPASAVLPVASTRIAALDWTKGALILFMVAYHAINYSAFRPLAFRYLAFLPPSFILITGFLVGQVYAAKYDLRTWKPYMRLAIRGFKLFLIFLVLNIVHCILLERGVADGLWEFGGRSAAIFLSGNGREGIFEVLLPIAYFLMLAPLLLWLRSRGPRFVALCAAGVFLICLLLELNGKSSKNLGLLSAGTLGMTLGLISLDLLDAFARGRLILTLFLYSAYRLCSFLWGETYPVQMFGATVSVLVLYCCAVRLHTEAWPGRQLVLLGQYSLLGYLAQIALLQAVIKIAGGKPQHSAGVIIVALPTAVFLFILIKALHVVRRRSRISDLAYKAVFA